MITLLDWQWDVAKVFIFFGILFVVAVARGMVEAFYRLFIRWRVSDGED